MSRGAILPNRGLADRLSALFWRRPTVLLLLLITPPLLWLGVVYLGSLGALLLQSFYSIDEFSGVVVEEFTLKTYGELFRAANMDIILRTLTMSASVTLASAVIGCGWWRATSRLWTVWRARRWTVWCWIWACRRCSLIWPSVDFRSKKTAPWTCG